jgi:hypothetical protein
MFTAKLAGGMFDGGSSLHVLFTSARYVEKLVVAQYLVLLFSVLILCFSRCGWTGAMDLVARKFSYLGHCAVSASSSLLCCH